jgi:hypothetical protein
LNFSDGLKFRPEWVILFFAEKRQKSTENHLSTRPKGAANKGREQ